MTKFYFILLLIIITLIHYNESIIIIPMRSGSSYSKKLKREKKNKQINQMKYYKNVCGEIIYPYEYTSKPLTCSEIIERNERLFRKLKYTEKWKNFSNKFGKPENTIFVMGDYDKWDYHMKWL